MPVPTLFNIVSKHDIQPLKALGLHNWLSWQSVNTAVPSTRFRLAFPDEIRVEPTFLKMLEVADPKSLLKYFIYSKLIVNGPKVLRPAADQCEALEHVDVNLPFADYQQPFPVFLVELPEAYRQSLAERFNHPSPRFVMVFHDSESGYIVTSCEYGPTRNGSFSIMSPRPMWKTIEDALRFSAEEAGPDLQLGEVLYRVAMNFGLLLTGYGAKDCGPIDPQEYAEQRRRAQKRKGHKARQAKELVSAAMHRIDFEQDVVFYESVKPQTPSSDAEGSMKRPHWRRGHFRRQPHGAGRTERRLVFVRPCFINADHFRGDKADTEYRIVAQGLGASMPAQAMPE